jgi:hypothetical protein
LAAAAVPALVAARPLPMATAIIRATVDFGQASETGARFQTDKKRKIESAQCPAPYVA